MFYIKNKNIFLNSLVFKGIKVKLKIKKQIKKQIKNTKMIIETVDYSQLIM